MSHASGSTPEITPRSSPFFVRWLLALGCLILAFLVPSGFVLLLPIAVFGIAGLIARWRSARIWRRELRDELENWEQHVDR